MYTKRYNKKNKKKASKNLTNCVIICAILLLIVLAVLLFDRFKPIYKVEPRAKQVAEEKKKKHSVEVLGWIRVQGTNIDYPIVYTPSNEKLNQMTGDFAWNDYPTTKLTNRPVIYGHNILNVSQHPKINAPNHRRFEQLAAFIYSDVLKDNKYIQYTIDGKDYVYKIFSVSYVKSGNAYAPDSHLTKDKMKKYIKQSKKDSYFDFDVDVDANDGIITLVTCTRIFGSKGYDFKIDARLVRNGEILSNYSFKEKNNYNKIKKILKGDEKNEKA